MIKKLSIFMLGVGVTILILCMVNLWQKEDMLTTQRNTCMLAMYHVIDYLHNNSPYGAINIGRCNKIIDDPYGLEANCSQFFSNKVEQNLVPNLNGF